jgi:hypothetical protein
MLIVFLLMVVAANNHATNCTPTRLVLSKVEGACTELAEVG